MKTVKIIKDDHKGCWIRITDDENSADAYEMPIMEDEVKLIMEACKNYLKENMDGTQAGI